MDNATRNHPGIRHMADRVDLLVADAHEADLGQVAVILAQFSGLLRAMAVSTQTSQHEPVSA